MQGLLLPSPAADMPSLDYPGRTRVHGSSCASTELPDQRYPMDEIQHQTSCELHIVVMNLTTRLAYGMVLPPKPDQKHHGEEIPKGYSVVSVEEVCEGFGDLELPIPGGDGAMRLSDALHRFILWNKALIVISEKSPSPPCSNPPPPPRRSPSLGSPRSSKNAPPQKAPSGAPHPKKSPSLVHPCSSKNAPPKKALSGAPPPKKSPSQVHTRSTNNAPPKKVPLGAAPRSTGQRKSQSKSQ
ncbi:hypothetical protein BS78_04G147900 [Paspalum vaginatum]|nr:hypothetical protein BS78_04G147900 [Paspalum vaginatum]